MDNLGGQTGRVSDELLLAVKLGKKGLCLIEVWAVAININYCRLKCVYNIFKGTVLQYFKNNPFSFIRNITL